MKKITQSYNNFKENRYYLIKKFDEPEVQWLMFIKKKLDKYRTLNLRMTCLFNSDGGLFTYKYGVSKNHDNISYDGIEINPKKWTAYELNDDDLKEIERKIALNNL